MARGSGGAAITKTGNAHLRRIIIEAAWAYRHRPAVGADAAETAGDARRRRSPPSRGRRSTACMRGIERLTARGKMSATAPSPRSDASSWGSSGRSGSRRIDGARHRRRLAPDARRPRMQQRWRSRGTRNGESSTHSYAAGLRARPAPLVRGSSRRITIMRFRPANIRVINRRDSRLDRHRCCIPGLEMNNRKSPLMNRRHLG